MTVNKFYLLFASVLIGGLFSCEKFVSTEIPKNSLVPENVFESDLLSTAALTGVYQQMASLGFASGDAKSISTILSVIADELIGYNETSGLRAAYENTLQPSLAISNDTWSGIYQRIYDVNGILEGIQNSRGISMKVKTQLVAEAYFIRAFCYFYLVNLYGPVPLHLGTDLKTNSTAERKAIDKVYEQILLDLNQAVIISEQYPTGERVRPNRSAVHMLLSKVHLYLGHWAESEKYAGLILAKDVDYQLEKLEDVFLKTSRETIWQLMPDAGKNTEAGSLLILTTAPTFVSLRPDFVLSAFDSDDNRKAAWIRSLMSNTVTYYYPFKYRIRQATTSGEYHVVFRLAESYLIRAESRARQGKLSDAIKDLDAVRKRAGRGLISNTLPNITKDELINKVLEERKLELFTEWGNRWLDLKRFDLLETVIRPIKPNFKYENSLFPIPQAEINQNKRIYQNAGY